MTSSLPRPILVESESESNKSIKSKLLDLKLNQLITKPSTSTNLNQISIHPMSPSNPNQTRRQSAAPTTNSSSSNSTSSSRIHHLNQQHLNASLLTNHQLSYYQQHTAELAAYITQIFLPSVLPTAEEYQIKEQTRQYLETLADKVSPGARLLPFGSIASGLALRNSDMDLCCLIDQPPNNSTTATISPTSPTSTSSTSTSSTTTPTTTNKHTPAEMVLILGKLIQEETSFMVKMLPKARIPIIKLSLPPSVGQPFGLSCDIGFENRLALENTRLLLTYAMVDPRMRTIVLFLKVWTKRRRINDPYLGTLSSYGYVLLVIYYLVNGRKSAVLPNLQQLPPPRPSPPSELVHEGHSIYFFDDLDALPRYWSGNNRENVGELLIDFFRLFASNFRYTHDVISIRSPGGLLSKESKGWMHDLIEEGNGRGPYGKVDLNRLCIEDPFQTNYNVARTVTRDGLFTIRGEFMRAVRVLSTRTDRLDVMIRELCEERQEGVLMAPPSASGRRKSAPNPKPTPPPLPVSQAQPQTPTQTPTGQMNEFESPVTPVRSWNGPTPDDSRARVATNGFSHRDHLDEEEEEEDEFQQLLLHQQQPHPPHPTCPPLTARLMQDHVYRQATTSTDARPRYPPESIASEPTPELDWHLPNAQDYLAGEIQALQLRQLEQRHNFQQQQQQQHQPDRSQPPVSSTNTGVGANYFHRFFRAGGSNGMNEQNISRPPPQPSPTLTSTPNQLHPQTIYESTMIIPDAYRRYPDFSGLPTPGPIRFGNFSNIGGNNISNNIGILESNNHNLNHLNHINHNSNHSNHQNRKIRSVSADLPTKIVFGDVEVVTPKGKRKEREARLKAVTAVLRNHNKRGNNHNNNHNNNNNNNNSET